MEEELLRKMRDVMAKAHGEPGAEVYGAAVAILRHYLGDEFIAKKVRLSPAPDAFLLNEENDQSDGRFVHMTRVAELADFLFILKDSPGFDVLCNRLRNRETQASFSDAMAAATFREHGFNVEIRSERGVRGEDFDFSARKDGALINLEVTSSTSPLFRPETISNILSSKRDQLPADAPAGLYCVIPISWFDEGADVQAALRERTLNFFNRSKRINFVNYVWHGMHKQGDGVVMPTVSFPVINDNARMPAPDLGLLTWSHPAAEDFKSAVAAGRVFAAQPGDDMRYMQFVRSR